MPVWRDEAFVPRNPAVEESVSGGKVEGVPSDSRLVRAVAARLAVAQLRVAGGLTDRLVRREGGWVSSFSRHGRKGSTFPNLSNSVTGGQISCAPVALHAEEQGARQPRVSDRAIALVGGAGHPASSAAHDIGDLCGQFRQLKTLTLEIDHHSHDDAFG